VRVLVLGNDTPTGYSLSAFASPLRRHELLGVGTDALRWRRERQVRRLLRDTYPDVVVDTRIVTQIDSSDRIGSRDIERTGWLADYCERMAPAIFYYPVLLSFQGR